MPGSQLRFEQVYDLPREIVWDALVDSDLVSGWLAEADVDARIGGRFDLDWSHLQGGLHTAGEILELVEPRLLIVDTSNFGRTTITLDELDGGTRVHSTQLTVDVHAIADLDFSATISATWQLGLTQLAALLRGHPVDWSTWRAVYGSEWDDLVADATRRK